MTLTNPQLVATIHALTELGTNYRSGATQPVVEALDKLANLGWDEDALDWLIAEIEHVRPAYYRATQALVARL